MKILIRAEGGSKIGMGHVMRMLVLAEALADFAEVEFACRDYAEFQPGIAHIEALGYHVHRINGNAAVAGLGGIGGDCLITDSYEVDEDYFECTKKIFGVTGYMDDLNQNYIYADFIINQNIYAEDMEYKVKPGTKLFLGPQYALLRKEFQGLSHSRTTKHMRNVLVTMGGTDPGNLSEQVALLLGRAFPEIVFHIAAGLSFSSIRRLKEITGSNIMLHIDPAMAALMQSCDAAVSACGSTIYELCACGTPVVGLVTASNQRLLAEKMAAIGAIEYAGELEELTERLKGMDHETRGRMAATGRSLVDGNGSIRLAHEIKKILCI